DSFTSSIFSKIHPNYELIPFYSHYPEILNFFDNRSTNASAESFNAKLKAFRATLRGVVDIEFFLFRVAKIYA
ncbi:MAG: transposase, partial [Prolixibacteraceae bacterium]